MSFVKIPRKLIEVALPLEAINVASAREKSIRHGHPSTLHLWWARRPLAAARAVIFSQMVDDPSAHPDLFPTEKAQEKERQRLFRLIEKLVKWENTTNEELLQQARDEIWESWRRTCAANADRTGSPAGIRIVAATRADLQRAARTGSFCAPLFYSLAILPVLLPPCASATATWACSPHTSPARPAPASADRPWSCRGMCWRRCASTSGPATSGT